MSNESGQQGGLYRQGDVLLVRVEQLPEGAVATKAETPIVLAEGEATGHAHVVRDGARLASVTRSRRWAAPLTTTYLVVDAVDGATVEHEEHSPIALAQGVYEVRRQREYRSGGWHRVSD